MDAKILDKLKGPEIDLVKSVTVELKDQHMLKNKLMENILKWVIDKIISLKEQRE